MKNFPEWPHRVTACWALVGCLSAAIGCGGQQRTTGPGDGELRQQGDALFGDAQPGARAGGAARPQGWTVAIATFPATSDGLAQAQSALERVRTVGGLPEARLERRGERWVLAYGAFAGPGEPDAQRSLRHVRSVRVEGVTPYLGAVLAPPPEARGTRREYDLSTVADRMGVDALYTLQIGMYGRSDDRPPTPTELTEFQRTAEQAVVDLRRQGVEAFYFHGPARSTVTVGVFGPQDHDPYEGRRAESERLREMRRQFPHSLFNGRGLRRSGSSDLESSRLVAIPR